MTDRNFRAGAARYVQDWVHNMIDAKPLEISNVLIKLESLEFKVPIVCLATGCVSRPRERH